MSKVILAAFLIVSLILLPSNVNGLSSPDSPECTISKPSGYIGTPIQISGNSTPSAPVSILFQNENVTQYPITTNSAGLFNTTLFVPPVVTGNYTISIEVGGKFYSCAPGFQVTFGTDTLAKMDSTLTSISNSLSTFVTKTSFQGNITVLQAQLTNLTNTLMGIRSSIQTVSSVANAQATGLSNLYSEINNMNQSVSSLTKQITEINATLAASREDSARQEQFTLISIMATIGVGVVLLIVIQFGSRRKRRPRIDDWEIFD